MVRVLAACSLLLLTCARPAAAEEWHFTPMAGVTFLGNTSIVDIENATGSVHAQLGGSVALLTNGIFGLEAVAVYVPGFFESDAIDLVKSSRSYSLMANVVITAPQRWTEYGLRPFVSGGFGLLHASVEDNNDVLPAKANLSAFNVGGGAIGFLSQHTGLRFDLRYFSSLRQADSAAPAFGRPHMRYMTFSVGVVFRR